MARPAAALALLSLALPLPAAAQVELQPSLGVSVIASDNIELRPSDEARKDLVTLVNPTLQLLAVGNRYEFSTRYRMDLLYYARSRERKTEVFNDLDSQLGLRLIGDNLRLDSRAVVTQVNADPRGALSNDNIARTGNRDDAVNLETRPTWQQSILGHLFTTSYTIGQVRYSDERLRDTTYQLVNTRIDSPEVEQGLSWDLNHSYRRFGYDDIPDFRNQLLELSVFWNTARGFAPFFTVGLESDFRERTGSSLDDSLWLVGARQSGERFIVELAAGRRSYGDTVRALAEYRYGRAEGDLIRLSYTEQPTNTEEDRLRRQEGFLPGDPDLPIDIEGPGTGRVYTRKRLELLVRREFTRLDLGLRVYSQRDDDFLLAIEPVRGNNRENGASATLNYDIGNRTDLRLEGSAFDRRFGLEGESRGRDRRLRLRAGLEYELGRLTALSVYGQRDRRSGGAFEGRGYREHQAGIRIDRRFY